MISILSEFRDIILMLNLILDVRCLRKGSRSLFVFLIIFLALINMEGNKPVFFRWLVLRVRYLSSIDKTHSLINRNIKLLFFFLLHPLYILSCWGRVSVFLYFTRLNIYKSDWTLVCGRRPCSTVVGLSPSLRRQRCESKGNVVNNFI